MNPKPETPTVNLNASGAKPDTGMDAPNGLDLNPRPPRSVRVSKRAAGALMVIAAFVLGLFAYGGYKRQEREVATLAEGSVPHNVAPATEAGIEIAKEIPSGRTGMADSGPLQPPGDLQPTGPLPNGGQVYVRQAPAPPNRHRFRFPSLVSHRPRSVG